MTFFPATIVEDLTVIDGMPPQNVGSATLERKGKVWKFSEKSSAMAKEVMIIACLSNGANFTESGRTIRVEFQERLDGDPDETWSPIKTKTLYSNAPSGEEEDTDNNHPLVMTLNESEVTMDEATNERYYVRMYLYIDQDPLYGNYVAVLFGGKARQNPHTGWKFSPTEDDTASLTQLIATVGNSIK